MPYGRPIADPKTEEGSKSGHSSESRAGPVGRVGKHHRADRRPAADFEGRKSPRVIPASVDTGTLSVVNPCLLGLKSQHRASRD